MIRGRGHNFPRKMNDPPHARGIKAMLGITKYTAKMGFRRLAVIHNLMKQAGNRPTAQMATRCGALPAIVTTPAVSITHFSRIDTKIRVATNADTSWFRTQGIDNISICVGDGEWYNRLSRTHRLTGMLTQVCYSLSSRCSKFRRLLAS